MFSKLYDDRVQRLLARIEDCAHIQEAQRQTKQPGYRAIEYAKARNEAIYLVTHVLCPWEVEYHGPVNSKEPPPPPDERGVTFHDGWGGWGRRR